MKTSKWFMGALGATLIASGSANLVQAAPGAPDGANKSAAKAGGRGNANGRMQRLIAELNLTSAQQAKMKKVQDSSRAKMKALRAETGLTPEQMKTKRTAIRTATRKEMEAILTPEQKKKWAEMRKKERAERRESGAAPGAKKAG